MADSIPAQPIISACDAVKAGKIRYFTGEPCRYGHIAERRVSNRYCVQCEIDRQAKRSQTPEWKNYRLAWDRKQQATNGDKVRAKARESYKRHKPRILQQVKRYQETNREEICERKRRRYHSQSPEEKRRRQLADRYGITPNEYERMYREQGGACAICNEPQQRLHVDHCHWTKHIRGLLCANCNAGLGQFKDNVKVLAKAIDYLEDHFGRTENSNTK